MVTNEAQRIIGSLGLQAHPEGGHYRETYRQVPPGGGRGAMTAIYYLLQAGERSAWHRLHDADEIWLFHAGAPLTLSLAAPGAAATHHLLGAAIGRGERPQILVPAGCWQSAVSSGAWTLVGCTVAPAFEFASFEMAPADWAPPERAPAERG